VITIVDELRFTLIDDSFAEHFRRQFIIHCTVRGAPEAEIEVLITFVLRHGPAIEPW